MRVIADLHIHSRFSRATSQRIDVKEISVYAKKKGLNLVGTGDFTHPKWIKELRKDLVESQYLGIFEPAKKGSSIYFVISAEVCTIFVYEGKAKKIHHVVLTPDLETATQINERLERYGDLIVDGRPTLNMEAPHLVEEIMEVSSKNEVIPAHVWTPWFSLFGASSGFDRIEDCYKEMTKHIHALETGLSSDPSMNWRLSCLDKFTLVSNSDSHSCWPWRLGREANVFDLETLAYDEILRIIREKDMKHFKLTIETNPAYGKYHWTGHRDCGIFLPPREAIKYGNICPNCHQALTKGVEQRVEELADRPAAYKPEKSIGYITLLPLSEIIASVQKSSSPSVQSVWNTYDSLVRRFGDEYSVLIDASIEKLSQVVERKLAEAIIEVREGKIKISPGYDGVYGQFSFFDNERTRPVARIPQRSLTDFAV